MSVSPKLAQEAVLAKPPCSKGISKNDLARAGWLSRRCGIATGIGKRLTQRSTLHWNQVH